MSTQPLTQQEITLLGQLPLAIFRPGMSAPDQHWENPMLNLLENQREALPAARTALRALLNMTEHCHVTRAELHLRNRRELRLIVTALGETQMRYLDIAWSEIGELVDDAPVWRTTA